MSTEINQDLPPIPPVGAPCWVEIMASEPQKLKVQPLWCLRGEMGEDVIAKLTRNEARDGDVQRHQGTLKGLLS